MPRIEKRRTISESQVGSEVVRKSKGRATWWSNPSGIAHHPDGSRVKYGVGHTVLTKGADKLGICWANGRFLAFELKRPHIRGVQSRGKPTEGQLKFLALVNRVGGYGAVVASWQEADWHLSRAEQGLEFEEFPGGNDGE